MSKNKKTFYITTPIYYPSGNLHIGHLLTTTLAWVYKNFKQSQGYETFFSTGIDEHGQKIQKKAIENNLDPQKYVDIESQKFVDLWNLLEIDYDFYSRTTNENHKQIVLKVFEKMFEKGYLFKNKYSGLYSVNDEEFLTKTQAVYKNNQYFHPISGHLLQEIEEESYFFNMQKFEPWIKKFFLEKNDFLTNKSIEKELNNNFLSKGLENLSVTRVSFDWGIKIPINQYQDKKQHVIYVWLDALFSYISALGFEQENNQNYLKFWQNGNERVHVLAKEISRFHAIYWPIFLKSIDINLPTKEVIHSWIITPEGKMSKSKGNIIEPIPLIKKYGAEEIKYFFTSQINIDHDFSFSEELLVNVLNADLANNFGNLVNRTIKMINQNFSNGTKFIENDLQDIDKNILDSLNSFYEKYLFEFNNFHADKALKNAILLSSKLNEYIDLTKPWLLKNDLKRLNVVLNTLLNGIYVINLMLSVVMPKKTKKILNFLKLNSHDQTLILDFKKFDNLNPNASEILFARIAK
ncbi:Methionyl-tRNA synthetase (Methionine-tRNAligase, MetRS) [Metamycoplasma alkalescens 14918]|uniref:Methionine--tRNA ligase n=2 Tax=Metamycoplasma alkalescens TaxID=45363 RepID=N9U027_9BACT|nr:methionine--tRNA ligase [Metamycoplasma alkalescens]ENY53912.1 Methionyl-tRNA synthetase (Methionine-tRNAligase, MetRS) [Metamycoplasma alkalescens 14918]